ncbi:MAG: CHASE2 domain-containing protein [Burkholderiales bacterium]|nr:CHASE2 domain-containing protein [Burkholderiales bacterium]
MKKLDFWRSDWFIGVVATLVVLVFSGQDLLQSLERKAYDLGVRATSQVPNDRIAVIAIDDQSIANIGRWPWSREVHAKMTEILTGAKAKVIGYNVFFFEPQIDPGLEYINKLSEAFAASSFRNSADPAAGRFNRILTEAAEALNTDAALQGSFRRANNVLLPFVFQALVEPQGNPDKPLPEYMAKSAINASDRGIDLDRLPIPAINPLYPLEGFATSAVAMGHLNADRDVDGAVRTEPLVVRYYDKYFPALSVMLAAQSLNLKPSDIRITFGEELSLGKLRIRTDSNLRMYTYFYSGHEGGRSPFPIDSFFDVFTGKIPADKYRDKVVLIGPTATGLGQAQVTPVSAATSPVETMAHTVSSILKEHFFVAPGWGIWVRLLLILLVAAYLIAVLPKLKAGMGAAVSAAILITLIVAHFALMVSKQMWLQFMTAAALLVIGHALLTTKRFLVTERGKEKSEAESAHSNRMLGLALQGQGQLDMAFDMFRKLPIDDSVMDLLYNLALDFERKRQFNKAESVFRYMADYNPKFRDLEQRLGRAKAMSETVLLGGGTSHPGGTMVLGAGAEKPMLGRYQVERELGKGAMGVVYGGRDPKINRVVAIKTMALAQEFDADELEDVKARFFREAETAGRLTHPNIVTIYDAGEEHDLAYIAMEFLKGKDLVPYTKPDNLLPMTKTMSIVARVAEALGYAHTQNVVHRDVKPANVMWEPESDTVKVTDFGIARITDSSRTKTGMVLGTPSYMSPEQLAGRKIGGQSDLFSLGATLFQMICGQLPFQGDSMAQLMFKIANEPHPDILTIRPDVPDCLAAVINRALAKNPDERFQTGEEMAKAIRACAASLTADTVDIGL